MIYGKRRRNIVTRIVELPSLRILHTIWIDIATHQSVLRSWSINFYCDYDPSMMTLDQPLFYQSSSSSQSVIISIISIIINRFMSSSTVMNLMVAISVIISDSVKLIRRYYAYSSIFYPNNCKLFSILSFQWNNTTSIVTSITTKLILFQSIISS